MVMALTAFHIATLVAGALLLIAAAVNDSRRLRIPNILSGVIVALFPLFVLTSPHSIEWEQNIIVSLLVLVSGFAMFLGNLAGAGDIKLLAATALWAGPHFIAVFIILTAIAGGFLALGIAAITFIRNRHEKEAVPLAKVPIPYGIAIAFGGLNTFYLLLQPILSLG